MVCLQFYTVCCAVGKVLHVNKSSVSQLYIYICSLFPEQPTYLLKSLSVSISEYILILVYLDLREERYLFFLKKTLLTTLIQVLLKEVGLYLLFKVTHSLAVQTSRVSFFF